MKKRRSCVECGGPVILARENEFYTAVEPVCSICGLVHDFDVKEFLDLLMVAGDVEPGILRNPPRLKHPLWKGSSASYAPISFSK